MPREVSFRRARFPLPNLPAALALVAVENLFVNPSEMSCTLVFNTTADAPLSDVSGSDPGKWNARAAGKRFFGDSIANNAFDRLDLHLSVDEADAGANEINYTNAPSDIGDSLGRM